MTEQTYDIYYDKEADFLEVFFGEPTKCYTEETEQGIFIRKDEKTHEVKSIGILSFKKRGTKILEQVLNKIKIRIPLEVTAID